MSFNINNDWLNRMRSHAIYNLDAFDEDTKTDLFMISDTVCSKHDTNCCICLCDESDCSLPCGHNYHRVCVSKWFVKADIKACPYCRQNVDN